MQHKLCHKLKVEGFDEKNYRMSATDEIDES